MPCSRVQPNALIPVSTTSSAADSVMSAIAPSRAVSDEYNPISSASCSAYSAHPWRLGERPDPPGHPPPPRPGRGRRRGDHPLPGAEGGARVGAESLEQRGAVRCPEAALRDAPHRVLEPRHGSEAEPMDRIRR